MQPILATVLGRPGTATRTSVVSAAHVAKWRAAGRPGVTLPVHRYRFPRHELTVAEGTDEHTRVLTIGGRPAGRVESLTAPRGPRGALSLWRHQRAARAGDESGILLGDVPLEVVLLTGTTAGEDGRRLRASAADEVWTIAERSVFPQVIGVWRGEPSGKPLAWLRARQELGWEADARLAELVLLECIGLRYPTRELEVILSRLGSFSAGDDRFSVLSPLGRLRSGGGSGIGGPGLGGSDTPERSGQA